MVMVFDALSVEADILDMLAVQYTCKTLSLLGPFCGKYFWIVTALKWNLLAGGDYGVWQGLQDFWYVCREDLCAAACKLQGESVHGAY
jgi:hypothetical protein